MFYTILFILILFTMWKTHFEDFLKTCWISMKNKQRSIFEETKVKSIISNGFRCNSLCVGLCISCIKNRRRYCCWWRDGVSKDKSHQQIKEDSRSKPNYSSVNSINWTKRTGSCVALFHLYVCSHCSKNLSSAHLGSHWETISK